MAQLFRIGIVGCGRISNAHVHATLAHSEVQLAALVDAEPARAHALANRFGITTTIATDVDAVLNEIDGAVIATPNHTHAEIAVRCLERKVSVLIEKPLAVSIADGERICRAARISEACVAVGYVTRFRQNVQLMRRLLEEQAFGAVRRFAYQFGSRGGWAPLSAYNLDRAATGGGVLVVTGTHFLDRMLDWFGYPADMSLTDDSEGGPEANAVATFRFHRDQETLHGVARFSKSVALEGGLVIETDQGVLILKDRPEADVVFRPVWDDTIQHVIKARALAGVRPGGEFLLQLQDFVQAARMGRPPTVTGSQGLESLRLIDDLYTRRVPMQPTVKAGGGGGGVI